MDFLDYPDVFMEVKGAMADGRLKLTDEEIIFKATKSGKTDQVCKDDIDIVNWQRLSGTWGIRIFTQDGQLHRFAGFREADREKLARFFTQTYKKDLLDRELSVKGWNWGTANFNGNALSFEVGGKNDAFEIPLHNVQQCLAGKNEVTLEFHQNDEAAVNLSEIRFHIPSSELAGEDPVEAFRDQVMKKASVMTASGDAAIASFSQVSCLSPRGRYDVKIFPTYIHLHGKTFDYKIPSSTVVRLFLLPHKDGRQMHFAVNCDPPIKQGQTRYHYLVFIFKEEDEEEVEIPLSEDDIKEKYDGKLQKEMTGKTYEVISKIFKAAVNRKITIPGSFLGHSGTTAVTCSHKSHLGFLYPLERGLIYIYKPPIYLRYDELSFVEFERAGGSSRSFDISVSTIHDILYTFSSIEKGEYGKLYDYFKSKNVKVRARKAEGSSTYDDLKGDEHHDAYMAKIIEELSEGSGDMSSDDEDFNPDTLEALSAKEEYDSEPSTTSSESEQDDLDRGPEAEKEREERRQKKAEKKAAKEKKSSKPKAERKVKKVKLPGQPKRNLSAYFLWMNESREKIKKENPGLSVAEFGKKAGEIWRTVEDKSEWEAKASIDKKRYEKEFEEWKAKGGAERMAAVKKEAKLAKKAAAKASKDKTISKSVPTTTSGSGGNFKSAEFIEDDSTSSNDDD